MPSTEVWLALSPGWGTRPWLAFMPTRPLKLAGIRIEPPPSLAVAIGTWPAATAAALTPDDPPGVRSVFHGTRVTQDDLLLSMCCVQISGIGILRSCHISETLIRALYT